MLGAGGFGRVYLATDEKTGSKNRHQSLLPRRQPPVVSLRSFKLMSKTVASLDHPNIVPIYDVGCSSDEFPIYLVTKFIDGQKSR